MKENTATARADPKYDGNLSRDLRTANLPVNEKPIQVPTVRANTRKRIIRGRGPLLIHLPQRIVAADNIAPEAKTSARYNPIVHGLGASGH